MVRAECAQLRAEVASERRKSLELKNDISDLQEHMAVDAVPYDDLLEMEERAEEAEAENDVMTAQLSALTIENQKLRDDMAALRATLGQLAVGL